VKINDWVIDIRNGYVFKIEKDWGKYVLHDDYIDSGDVFTYKKGCVEKDIEFLVKTIRQLQNEVGRLKKGD
jgi:hypothetical protein